MSIWSGVGIKSDLHNMQINRYSTCSMGIGMGISILHFLLPSFKNWVSSCLYSNFFILGVLFGLLTHPHPVCSMACHDIWFHMTLNVLTSLYVLNCAQWSSGTCCVLLRCLNMLKQLADAGQGLLITLLRVIPTMANHEKNHRETSFKSADPGRQ